MSNKKERRRIVKELLDVTDKEFTDEELIHQLINTELSKDSDKTDKLSFGQRAADAVARFAGSWAFYIQLYSYNGYLDGSEYST